MPHKDSQSNTLCKQQLVRCLIPAYYNNPTTFHVLSGFHSFFRCFGGGTSKTDQEDEKRRKEANKRINAQIQKDKQVYRATHRLLLLGKPLKIFKSKCSITFCLHGCDILDNHFLLSIFTHAFIYVRILMFVKILCEWSHCLKMLKYVQESRMAWF